MKFRSPLPAPRQQLAAALIALFSLVLWVSAPADADADARADASAPVRATPCPADWQPAFVYDTTLYPFTNRCIDLSHGTIHYIDELPEGEPLGTVLMLHGNPSWSFIYRDIARDLLALGYRIIAPDYYGFGLSDKPPLASFGYTPVEHAGVIRSFVLALDLQDVTLVLHDWGGPIGIRMAGTMPERFSSYVILNTFLNRIRASNPGVNHMGVDFAIDNIVNETQWRESGDVVHFTGLNLAAQHAPPGDPLNTAIRNAYWGPFLDLENGEPLSPDIVAPTNIFAQHLLKSGPFLEAVKANLQSAISQRPLAMFWGHVDRMWGALRCDIDADPQCPGSTECITEGFSQFCKINGEDYFYPQIANIRQSWPGQNIVDEQIVLEGIHFVQEGQSAAIVAAIQGAAMAASSR